jgi:hypothetical protein
MAGRSWIKWRGTGSLFWTWPLTLAFIGAGVALWAAAVVAAVHESPAQAASDHPPWIYLAALGLVALIIGMSGRLTSVLAARYDDRPFPTVPQRSASEPAVPQQAVPQQAVPHHAVPHQAGPHDTAGPRRRSRRRISGIAYCFLALAVGFGGFVVPVTWSMYSRTTDLSALALAVAGAAGCWLAGPAAGFVVTPAYLHIDRALTRTSVPRTLIGGLSPDGTDVSLHLTAGRPVRFRVDPVFWDARATATRDNSRTQHRTADRIVTMLHQVPAAPAGADPAGTGVTTTPRYPMIAVAVLASLTAVIAAVLLITTPN